MKISYKGKEEQGFEILDLEVLNLGVLKLEVLSLEVLNLAKKKWHQFKYLSNGHKSMKGLVKMIVLVHTNSLVLSQISEIDNVFEWTHFIDHKV